MAAVEVSGGKQVAGVGAKLADPVVVQVNGADGNALPGALVSLRGDGLALNPTQALLRQQRTVERFGPTGRHCRWL